MSKTKKRLSLFSFASSDDSKDTMSGTGGGVAPSAGPLAGMEAPPILRRSITSLSSVNSIVSNNAQAPESIFERSVQDTVAFETDALNPPLSKRSPSYSHNSSISLKTGQFLKNEDYIAPALDATAKFLSSKNSDLDNIEMIYSSRRNSSVLGLNMALGRPFVPSRKNSMYSINQTASPSSATNVGAAATSPVSPAKLTSSSSTVSFYSYADMINNEDGRRPSFKSSYSQGFIPTVSSPTSQSNTALNSLTGSMKLKNGRTRTGSNARMRGFLISPESSDEERELTKLTTTFDNEDDGEKLISSSIGECLRRTNTEISSSDR